MNESDPSYGLRPMPKPILVRPPLSLPDSALSARRAKLLLDVDSGRFSDRDALPLSVFEAQLDAEQAVQIQEIKNRPDWEFEKEYRKEGGKSRQEAIRAVKARIHRRKVQGIATRDLIEERTVEEEEAKKKQGEEKEA